MKRVTVEALHGKGRTTTVISKDGRTITKRQYRAALDRVYAPVQDGLRIVDEPIEFTVMDGDKPYAILSGRMI